MSQSHAVQTLASLLTGGELARSPIVSYAERLSARSVGPRESSELRPLFSDPQPEEPVQQETSEEEFHARVEEARLRAVQEVQEVNSRELAEISERYAATFMRMDEAIASIPKVITSEVVDLALLVAQEIMHAELRVSEDLVFRAVERALTDVPHDGTVTVFLNPDDLEGVQGRLEGAGMLSMKWEANSELRHGDCVVQMPDRIIDASLDSRLEAVRDTLVRTLMADELEEKNS